MTNFKKSYFYNDKLKLIFPIIILEGEERKPHHKHANDMNQFSLSSGSNLQAY